MSAQSRAHYAVRNALIRGLLVRADRCAACGEVAFTEAHHPDYNQPLDVVWLCVHDHRVRHNRERFQADPEGETRRRGETARRAARNRARLRVAQGQQSPIPGADPLTLLRATTAATPASSLREARLAAGLSQAEVGRALGVSRQAVRGAESHHRIRFATRRRYLEAIVGLVQQQEEELDEVVKASADLSFALTPEPAFAASRACARALDARA